MIGEKVIVSKVQAGAELLEKVVVGGDLAQLTPAERLLYYRQVCDSLGLNALSRPFDYLNLNGKLVLYARREAAEQLRKINKVSVTGLDTQILEGVYIVKAQARMPDGRTDMSTGAVSIKGLSGDALANAILKAETKAKRRVTLSICGLGMLDETEIETVPMAERVTVDVATGEVAPITDPAFVTWFSERKNQQDFWGNLVKGLGLDSAAVHQALRVAKLAELGDRTLSDVRKTLTEYAEQKKMAADADALFGEDAKREMTA